MKKNQKRLSLNKVQVSELNAAEQQALNGGFLSIGHECSVNNTCGRLVRNGDADGVTKCIIHFAIENEMEESAN